MTNKDTNEPGILTSSGRSPEFKLRQGLEVFDTDGWRSQDTI